MKPGWTITHFKGEMAYIFPFSLIFQIIILQSYVKLCICISNELLENHNTSNYSCEWDIPNINSTYSEKTFTTKINIIRKQLKTIGSNKSVEPDGIPSAILKLGGEAMIPYLARLLDITVNNGTLPKDWKRAVAVPIHKGGDRSSAKNYRPVSLTSVVFLFIY